MSKTSSSTLTTAEQLIMEMEKIKWQAESVHGFTDYKTQREERYNDGIIEGMERMIQTIRSRSGIDKPWDGEL